jgi:hypothetical protein
MPQTETDHTGAQQPDTSQLLPSVAQALTAIHAELSKTSLVFRNTPSFEVLRRSDASYVLRFPLTLEFQLHLASPTSGGTPTKSDETDSSSRAQNDL